MSFESRRSDGEGESDWQVRVLVLGGDDERCHPGQRVADCQLQHEGHMQRVGSRSERELGRGMLRFGVCDTLTLK